jgi:hypothetical protein
MVGGPAGKGGLLMGGWGGERWYPEGPPAPRKPKRIVEPGPQTPDPQFPDEGDETVDRMREIYTNLRFECAELEALIGANSWSEQDLKRLDKAVTVMKVGFKMLKKVARKPSRAKIGATGA